MTCQSPNKVRRHPCGGNAKHSGEGLGGQLCRRRGRNRDEKLASYRRIDPTINILRIKSQDFYFQRRKLQILKGGRKTKMKSLSGNFDVA